jgi:hypothetical protein
MGATESRVSTTMPFKIISSPDSKKLYSGDESLATSHLRKEIVPEEPDLFALGKYVGAISGDLGICRN